MPQQLAQARAARLLQRLRHGAPPCKAQFFLRHLLQQLLHGPETHVPRVAAQLGALQAHYGFEGWLVNVETPVSATAIDALSYFLIALTQHAKQASPTHGRVLWYDAVTTHGHVAYQNALSPLNAPFFHACDGILTNYWWAPALCDASARLATSGTP